MKLVAHITHEVESFLSSNPDGGVIVSGDMNFLDLGALLETDASLKQVVKVPTRKDKTLDIVVTNLKKYYLSPIAILPLQPDDPAHAHPSDHSGILVLPLQQQRSLLKNQRVLKIHRFPESKMNLFGQIISL